MTKNQPAAPLSPPNSPRMSKTPTKAQEHQWHQTSAAAYNNAKNDTAYPGPYTATHNPSITNASTSEQLLPGQRTHKSFIYPLGPPNRYPQDVGFPNQSSEGSDRVVSSGPKPPTSAQLPPLTFGGSAPTSPAGRLTPRSSDVGMAEEALEDDDIDLDDAPEGGDEDRPPMTAAELRAHKRKMKRFRLTHSQTRFLMSEFARQAHPDAAHRERLSREIPGLSPRQVQVWFQNRRAKLKRLTTDDRERMMRSRALPADFDMTQALHSPFGAAPTTMGTPMPSPGTYGQFGEGGGVRPLTLDTLRRIPDYEHYNQQYVSPTGISPAMGGFAFTPPQSATETVSPGSAVSEMSSFLQHRAAHDSPRRPGAPFGLPMTGPVGFGAHHSQMPRLHMHERFGRPMGESASSPLRTSISYSSLGSHAMPQHQPSERAASFSDHASALQERGQQSRSLTNPTVTTAPPYGLGFSYANMPGYSTNDQQNSTTPTNSGPQVVGFHQYRQDSIVGPPISGYSQSQPPPAFATPQVPQYTSFNPPSYAQPPTYSNSMYHQQPPASRGQRPAQLPPYPHQQQQQQQQSQQLPPHQSYSSMSSQPQHQYTNMGPSSSDVHSQDEADNSDGGVPVPASY